MKIHTYTLENNYDTEYSEGASHVRFAIDELDVVAITAHAEYIKANNLLCVEDVDYRCEFWDEDEEGSLIPTDFRQDTPRLAIFGDYIVFTGYQKHGSSNTEWSTNRLMIADIAKDFGVAL